MTLRQLINKTIFPKLLKDFGSKRLKAPIICVYMSLYHFPMQPTIAHAKRLGWAKTSIWRAISDLAAHRWIYRAEEKGPYESDLYIAWMPTEVESQIADELLKIRNEIPFVGEWLTKCLLDILVSDTDVWDNARPPWLVKQDGGGRLEFDRWYRSAGVVIEFQGSQHYRIGTDFSTTETDLNRQIMHDNIKAGICHRHDISYVEIAGSELNPNVIRSKIRDLLPLYPLRESGPIFSTLTKMCASYVNSVIRSDKRVAQRAAMGVKN